MATTFNALQHEQEIVSSRTNGLGGSDAAMVLRFARKGMETISRTDMERLQVLVGTRAMREHYMNAAMKAGHRFEELAQSTIVKQLNEENGFNFAREYKMAGDDYKNFATFAHADFYDEKTCRVIECKYSQKDTEDVMDTYQAQLQWYYLIGAKCVTLLHGFGSVEPFQVEDYGFVHIERNEEMICELRDGLRLIDEYVSAHDMDANTEDVDVLELDNARQTQVAECSGFVAKIKQIEEKLKQAREALQAYMEQNGIRTIDSGVCRVTWVAPTTRKSFDTKAAQAKYPDLKGAEYYKETQVKSTIKIELK